MRETLPPPSPLPGAQPLLPLFGKLLKPPASLPPPFIQPPKLSRHSFFFSPFEMGSGGMQKRKRRNDELKGCSVPPLLPSI